VKQIEENSSDAEIQKHMEDQGSSSGNPATPSTQEVGPSEATGCTSS
jgi:hypothetical protein